MSGGAGLHGARRFSKPSAEGSTEKLPAAVALAFNVLQLSPGFFVFAAGDARC